MADHIALLVIELRPWPETDAASLQLIALTGVEVLEFHLQLAVAPQWFGIGADVGGFDREQDGLGIGRSGKGGHGNGARSDVSL
mgnify:CR=1 FL=1